MNSISSEAAKAVVRRNTEEVQSGGNFEVFEELFADTKATKLLAEQRILKKCGRLSC